MAPPSASEMIVRKASALGLMILFCMAAIPFDPVAWFIMEDDPLFVGQILQVCGMLGSLYFQWSLATLKTALAVTIPNAPNPNQAYQNRPIPNRILLWLPQYYWPFAAVEAVLLFLAWATYYELFRRVVVLSVMTPLWTLGWHATPWEMKMWAWQMVKDMWFQMVVSELLWGGNRRRRRTGRR